MDLVQEHLLKRELLQLEIEHEFSVLGDFNNIAAFGPPFAPRPGQPPPDQTQFPVLRFIFRNCVQTFPFVASVDPKKFWQDQVQVFLQNFAAKDVSTSDDRAESSKRRRMATRLRRLVHIYMSSGLQTTRNEKQAPVEAISERGFVPRATSSPSPFVNGYQINVVAVRKLSSKRIFGSDSREPEYIVCAQMEGVGTPVYTARKFKDFRTLESRLRKEFPGKSLVSMPAQHKKDTAANLNDDTNEDDDSISVKDEPTDCKPSHRLYRERQRTTLRRYLRELLKVPQVARSQTFLEFLFRDPIRTLSADDLQDIANRQRMDALNLAQQQRFLEIATKRAKDLEHYIGQIKTELKAKDGFASMFGEIKERATIAELSPRLQKFVEWAGIEVAATLYQMLVASDNSPELLSQVRRIHHIMPYTVIRGILRYTNPMAMMKGMVDLFLAQPLGRRSLLQTIFYIVLSEDIKAQSRVIDELTAKIADKELVKVVHRYVETSSQVKQQVRERAVEWNVDVVLAAAKSQDLVGPVSHGLLQRLDQWHQEWAQESEESDAKAGDRYTQAKELLLLDTRRRDKDMMLAFLGESATMGLIKELVAIFYSPLIKVFKAANMHRAVGDLEKFVTDALKVVDRAELLAASSDPNELVESFISLCVRHQDRLYKFVHEVYVNDDGLFTDLIGWISNLIAFLRDGSGEPLDLVGVVGKAAQSPDVDVELVLQEMDALQQWVKDRRAWRDEVAARAESHEPDELDWTAAMPSAGLAGTDFGLDTNDVEALNDSDSEDDQSAGPSRPQIVETAKLLPLFHRELVRVLQC